jgi:hypothetical protein
VEFRILRSLEVLAATCSSSRRRSRVYARTMRKVSWMRAGRMILAALAFSGVWLWVGDGERILGPIVIVIAVMGLWALSWVESSNK